MKINRSGFTLIELMIVVALVSLIIPIIYSVFIYGLLTYNTSAGQIEIFRSAQPIILLLQNDIRPAIKVVDKFNDFKTSKNSIILEKRDNYVYYYQDKRVLIRKIITRAGEQKEIQRLSSCIENITFDYDKKQLISFKLSFGQEIRGKEAKLDLISSVKMRNWK
ncbi:MAG: prepilin-type N-terminal cleavage/methylation domain-containing protein [bacterium]|nr:prepilin-type N-terminal cleavage/methylation domain-containing protein [bacterium]